MKSIYEEAGGAYTRQGDYELPNLKVPPEKEIEIGVWEMCIRDRNNGILSRYTGSRQHIRNAA